MKYIVTTNLKDQRKLYHCDEPTTPSSNQTCGGFDFMLAGALTHDDMSAAKTTRNRMQKYYPDFPMYISTFEDKEIFIGLLKGTI